jgi:tetratricopeptide (TPR) repeat protein
MNRKYLTVVTMILVAVPCGAQLEEFDQTVGRVEQLVLHHRYQQVLDLLLPLDGVAENLESRYIIAAELGRAHFHLGQYQRAHHQLRRAVTIHPERIETALYLQATSYILGDRSQAFAILAEVLRSGARDRYLAVTLPGERRFLSDPEVWQLLEAHTDPVRVDLEEGRVGKVGLGSDRRSVARALGAPAKAAAGPLLTARAGPLPIWSYAFADDGTLSEVVLHNENLAKYTPYRLQISSLDWRTTPAEVVALLGPPDETITVEGITMRWHRTGFAVSMVFGHPRPPRPPMLPEETAMLLLVRLSRVEPAGAESDSIGS